MRRWLMLLTVLTGSPAAHALSICTNPAAHDGDAVSSCGSNWIDGSFALLATFPDSLILVCRGSSLGSGAEDAFCSDFGGTAVLVKPASLSASDLLHENYSGHEYWGSVDLSLGHAFSSSGGNSESVFPELTPEQGAALGGAVLLLWAATWAFREFLSVIKRYRYGDS